MSDQNPPTDDGTIVRDGLKFQAEHPNLLAGGHQRKGRGKRTVRVSDISRNAREAVRDSQGIEQLRAVAHGTAMIRDRNPCPDFIKKSWTILRPPTWAERRQAIMDLTDLGTKGKLILVLDDTDLARAVFAVCHKYVSPDLLDLFKKELKETLVNMMTGDGESPAEDHEFSVAHGVDGEDGDPPE